MEFPRVVVEPSEIDLSKERKKEREFGSGVPPDGMCPEAWGERSEGPWTHGNCIFYHDWTEWTAAYHAQGENSSDRDAQGDQDAIEPEVDEADQYHVIRALSLMEEVKEKMERGEVSAGVYWSLRKMNEFEEKCGVLFDVGIRRVCKLDDGSWLLKEESGNKQIITGLIATGVERCKESKQTMRVSWTTWAV